MNGAGGENSSCYAVGAGDANPGNQHSYLVSPGADSWLLGAASILFFGIVSFTQKNASPDSTVKWAVFYAAFAINYPHFLASYQLLYWDFRAKIFRELKFFWAAVVVPLILLGLLGACFFSQNPKWLGYFANAMYISVGWHYVKQIFGGISVCNARNKYFYNKIERLVLKLNLFGLWGLSLASANIGSRTRDHYGIGYESMDFSAITLQIAYWFVGLSAALTILAHFRKYIRDGKVPSKLGIVLFATIYCWYIPALYHPVFFLIIPFFHSLQYLVFVFSFRRNKVEARLKNPDSPEGRKERVLGLYGFLFVSVVTGALAFWIIPHFIDSLQLHDAGLFGVTPAMFGSSVFLNIHHISSIMSFGAVTIWR